jgi:hypothetical protein
LRDTFCKNIPRYKTEAIKMPRFLQKYLQAKAKLNYEDVLLSLTEKMKAILISK